MEKTRISMNTDEKKEEYLYIFVNKFNYTLSLPLAKVVQYFFSCIFAFDLPLCTATTPATIWSGKYVLLQVRWRSRERYKNI